MKYILIGVLFLCFTSVGFGEESSPCKKYPDWCDRYGEHQVCGRWVDNIEIERDIDDRVCKLEQQLSELKAQIAELRKMINEKHPIDLNWKEVERILPYNK